MRETRRVLFLHPGKGVGGAQTQLRHALDGLAAKGFAPCWYRAAGADQAAECSAATIFSGAFPPWRKLGGWAGLPACVLRLRRICLRHGVRLVVANDFWYAPLAVLVSRLTGIPCIVHVHDSAATARKASQYLVHHAAAVIVPSSFMRQRLAAAPALEPRIRVIPNGIDLRRFHPGVPGEPFRRELGANEGDLLVGLTGTLCENKGQRLLLRAAAPLAADIPRMRCVFIGAGPPEERAALEQHAAALGLGGRVHCVGARADMPTALSGLDLVVSASKRENAPFAVSEAMAAGKPVVYCDVGGIAEMVGDEAGVAVPPGDAAALAAALRQLLTAPAKRQQMGRAARARAEARFSLEQHLDALQTLFARVIERGAARD